MSIGPRLLLATLLLAGAARAQSVDPILAGFDAPEAQPASPWQPFGDVSLGNDHVEGLPGRTVQRLRARLRAGFTGSGERWQAAGSLKLGLGSDDNADNRRNLDNEKSNGIALDQAWFAWLPGADTRIELGQDALPLVTTPLTWDRDLRPIGLFVEQRWPVGDFDQLRLVAGHFRGHHLYGDDSTIDAVQLGWQWHAGAPFSFDLQLGWLAFDDLERLTREGLARSNRIVAGRLLSDYRLLDLQLGLQWQLAPGPLALHADVVDNQGADDADRGGRLSLILGEADRLTGAEYGFAWQRIGRDAVMAAFNADDWWFHSAARGVMPWFAYGWQNGWTVQASLFHERLDGRDAHVDRLLLQLRNRF